MAFNPDNSSINNDYGQGGGFKIGSDRQFGKIDAQIGMSSGFGDKSGVGKRGLDSLYTQAQHRRELKLQENDTAKPADGAGAAKEGKPEKGLLEYNTSASVNSTIRKTIEIMDKNGTSKIFNAKTTRDKIKIAKGLIDEIEGKKVSWDSYVHKGRANDTAHRVFNRGITELGGIKKHDNFTSMQAKKAVAGAIGELTRDKEIMRRANRT